MNFRTKLFLTLSAFLLLVGIAMVFVVQFPITGLLSEKILELPALLALHVKVEKIDATASGKVTLHGLSVMSKEVLYIPTVTLMVNREQLIHGHISIESLHADTLKISLSGVEKIKDKMTADQASWFRSKLTHLQKTPVSVTALRNISGVPWFTGEMKIRFDSVFTGGVVGRVQLKRATVGNYPAATALELKFHSNSTALALDFVRGQWAGGSIRGKLDVNWSDAVNPFQCQMAFRQINLARFKTLPLIARSNIEGIAQGKVNLKGSLNRLDDIQADGSLKVLTVSLKDLPFQRGALVEKYLPEITELRLQALEFSGISIRENRIEVANLKGQGDLFSFSGHASLDEHGIQTVSLDCNLDQKYFQRWSPFLSDMGMLKIQIDRSRSGALSGRVKAPRLGLNGLPDAEGVDLKFTLDSKSLIVENARCKWADGTIQGSFGVDHSDSAFPFHARIDLQKINLRRLTALGFFGHASVDGLLLGKVSVAGKLTRMQDAQVTGDIKIAKVRLKKFPVQQDKLILNYLPDLKDIRLNSLEISDFSWKENQILLPSLRGQGNPLSFTGHGRVGLNGLHSLRLNCAFNPKYCRKLNPIIRGAFVVNGRALPRIPCAIKGDLHEQTLVVDKAFSRVVGAIMRTVGKGILDEFDLTD